MRIGIIGDLHAPFVHPMYLRFCIDTFCAWKIDYTHFIGDIVDLHALGFWEHDPEGMSAEHEAKAALGYVSKWFRTFPHSSVSIGNHDQRPERVAKKYGMPARFIRDYADVWQTPSWDWQLEHAFDGVVFEHGTGATGQISPALNLAVQSRRSVVIGHIHSVGTCGWHANKYDRVFGLSVGCGIDVSAYAMAYGRKFARRPVLGCGIVIDGTHAYFIPMPCGRGEKYHRSRAGQRYRRPAPTWQLAA